MVRPPRRRPSDALDLYLSEIARRPLLAREREAELGRRWRETGDRRALNELVEGNLRFVVACARRYRGCGVPMEDLVNEGNLGLLRAAERFDPDRGVRFVTYAAWFVRQKILGALGRAGRAAPPVPDGGEGGGRRPRRAVMVSLEEAPGPGRRGTRLSERLEAPAAVRADRPVHRRERRRALETSLAFLPEREERVLRLFFGLDGSAPRSLARIGREMGVSRERARQIKDRALDRLRDGPHGARLRGLAG